MEEYKALGSKAAQQSDHGHAPGFVCDRCLQPIDQAAFISSLAGLQQAASQLRDTLALARQDEQEARVGPCSILHRAWQPGVNPSWVPPESSGACSAGAIIEGTAAGIPWQGMQPPPEMPAWHALGIRLNALGWAGLSHRLMQGSLADAQAALLPLHNDIESAQEACNLIQGKRRDAQEKQRSEAAMQQSKNRESQRERVSKLAGFCS